MSDIDLEKAYASTFAPEKVIFRVTGAGFRDPDPEYLAKQENPNTSQMVWYDVEFLDVEYEYLEGKAYRSSASIFDRLGQKMGLKTQTIRNAFASCGFKLSVESTVQALAGHAFEGLLYREMRDSRGFLVGTHMVLPTKHLGDASYRFIGERRFVARQQETGGQGVTPVTQAAPAIDREALLDALAKALDGARDIKASYIKAVSSVPGANRVQDIVTAAGAGTLATFLDGRVAVEDGVIRVTVEA